MDYVKFGITDYQVSRLGLGCGNFGGIGSDPRFFGQGENEKDAFRLMDRALDIGINFFDTADAYGGGRSETFIGRWLQTKEATVVDRILLSSKAFNPVGEGPNDRGLSRRHLKRQVERSLKRLGVDRLDMFLIHWPVPGQDKYAEAWKTLIELQQQGRIKSIGVSNFNQDHLERIIDETGVTPVVNQIELHPYFTQADKRGYLKSQNIHIESYSPLGSGAVLKDQTIKSIGEAHGKSIAQVIVRWHIQQGNIVIPKTTHRDRMKENFDVFDFDLSDDEMKTISGLDKGEGGRTGSNPATNNDTF